MQLKAADDKSADLEKLEALSARGDVNAATRRRIEAEIRTIRSGERGEHDAAYEMELYLGQNRNWVTIHDLRLEHDGFVAQIDHLIIDRLLDFWVCESKRVAQGVAINEHGEWARYYNGRKEGMASPVEQNKRHILILQRILDAGLVWLPRRLGLTIKPKLRNVVLLSNSARISRPRRKVAGVESVIKTEQLNKRLNDDFDSVGVPRFIGNVVGRDTIERIGRSLVELHRPASFDWAARFGLPAEPSVSTRVEEVPPASPTPEGAPEPVAPRRSGLTCARCAEPVSYAVARFCWFNKPRFGGNVYCMPCQKVVAEA